jgi:hypothetical protein
MKDLYAEDYSQVDFPYETKTVKGTRALLFACINNRIIGCTTRGQSATAQDWSIDGVYMAEGPSILDLVPVPKVAARKAQELGAAIDEARARLEAHPDAPADWRAVDEQAIKEAGERLKSLS